MRVLVTGANGFVGSALCRKLCAQGAEVRAYVRHTSDLSLLDGVPVSYVVGNLDDETCLAQAMQDVDVVFHIAGLASDWGALRQFRKVNVLGTQQVLNMAIRQQVKRFVYVSSTAVFGFTGETDVTEDKPFGLVRYPYSQSKREAELIIHDAHVQGLIETVIVRPGDVYGPGDRVVLLKLAPLLESGKLIMPLGGRKLGAFTYVDNLADGLILAGTVPTAAGETYHITDGVKLSWRTYYNALAEELGLAGVRFGVPALPLVVAANVLERVYKLLRIKTRPPITRYLVDHLRWDYHFSIEKAQRELGYAPAIGWREGVRLTAAWYKEVKG